VTTLQKVTVFGTGVLGSQIIMQAAYHGKDVTAYDVDDEALAQLPARWEWMRGYYQRDLPDFDAERFDKAVSSIRTTTDIADAVTDADVVIESIPENLELKKSVWAKIGEAVPERTVLLTNTSSLLPSSFADSTGHPERFLALHFANLVWKNNTGEVMATAKTAPEHFDAVLAFAGEIGLVPVPVRKEVPGYVLNSLLIPWLDAGAKLYQGGVSDPEDIDNVWKIATGAPKGPFEVYDVVGFNVAYNISRVSDDPLKKAFAEETLKKGIDAGTTGLGVGEGFYRYDKDGNNLGAVESWKQENRG